MFMLLYTRNRTAQERIVREKPGFYSRCPRVVYILMISTISLDIFRIYHNFGAMSILYSKFLFSLYAHVFAVYVFLPWELSKIKGKNTRKMVFSPLFSCFRRPGQGFPSSRPLSQVQESILHFFFSAPGAACPLPIFPGKNEFILFPTCIFPFSLLKWRKFLTGGSNRCVI